jgi:hypothetical protein
VASAAQVLLKTEAQGLVEPTGFYYYTWITNESAGASVDQFNFAGLLRFLNGRGTFLKPALGAFRKAALGIEGCRRKATLASSCIH